MSEESSSDASRALIADLQAERARLLAAQAVAEIGSWETDLAALSVVWSEQTHRIFETDPVVFRPTHEKFLNLVHPEDRAKVDAAFQASFVDRRERTVSHRLLLPKGHIKHVEERWKVFFDEAGKPVRAIGTCQDVTSRVEFQDELSRTQALLGMASRLSRLGAWRVDLPALRVLWSDETAAIHEEAPGFSPSVEKAIDYYAPGSRELISRVFTACVAEGLGFDIEAEILTAKGRRVWVRSMGEAVRDSTGRILRVEGAFQDISESKRAVAALEESTRALRLLSRGNEALIRSDTEQSLIEAVVSVAVDSGKFRLAWIGYALNDDEKTVEVRARAGANQEYLSSVKISWSQSHPYGNGPAGKAIREGNMVLVPDLAQDPSFKPWLADATASGFRGVICFPLKHAGASFGVLCLYLDQARTPQAEELRFLGDLANNVSFGIMSQRERVERRRVEEAVLTLARGVSAGTGLAFFERLVESAVKALQADAGFITNLSDDGQQAVTRYGYADGAPVPSFEYDVKGSPCARLFGSEVLVVERDVRKSFPHSECLRRLGTEAYVGTRLVDSGGRCLGVMFVLFRKPLADSAVISSTMKIFAARASSELERIEADRRIRELASLLDAARDAIVVRDLEHRIVYWNRSAERLYGWSAAEASGRTMQELVNPDPAAFAAALESLQSKGEWVGEIAKTTRGGEKIVIEGHWTLVKDERGAPQSVLLIDTDITERRKLESQFLRAQRMESLGTLAGGIAHDLNNMLSPIMMSIGWLRTKHVDSETAEVLGELQTCAQRGADLVKQVLSFARGVEGRRIQVDVVPLINEIKRVVRDTFPKSIVFEIHRESDLWNVTGDPTQLHQVLLNLCVNARDAMLEGGALTLRLGNVVLDDTYSAMNQESKPGAYVTVEVCDSGCGIPQEMCDRIFEPFFTTKDVGKGSGLGLSTSAAIVKSHGGFINLYSEVGKGSRFKVYLPANVDAATAETAAVSQTGLPRGNGETILVVDDEEGIRKVAQRTLERFGYRVMLAANGAEGLSVHARSGSGIALVLTDMAMPIMDGPAFIVALKAIDPSIRIVASSGFVSEAGVAKVVAAGVRHFVPKPYTAEALLRVLREALDEPPRDGGRLQSSLSEV
jgi:PAS domain S-box-containing protein